MKHKAIIRIVIWSLTIVVLTTIMVSGISGWSLGRFRRSETIEATMVPIPTERLFDYGTGELPTNAVTTEDVNIRSAPSSLSEAVGMLPKATNVKINREEKIEGQKWAYITAPQAGWVQMNYLSTNMQVPDETMVSGREPGEKDTFAASEISEIEINWVAGDILIQPGNTDQITVQEDGVTDYKYAMVLRQKGDELQISFCDEAVGKYFGVHTRSDLEKDLTILVPPDWVCETLDIECASATVEVNDLTIREVDFDGASGTCEFENCTVGEMDIDTASGDVRFVGSLEMLDCDAASASIYAVLNNVPNRLDMDSMSGDLDITLPQNAGFALSMSGLNMDFESDFDTTMKNGNYVCGDGSCRINVDAMSGDVFIRAQDEATATPTS